MPSHELPPNPETPDGEDSGFHWTGRLAEVSLFAVLQRCQRLRLTGRLALRDGDRQAEVALVNGRPQDGEEPAGLGFSQGEFHVIQQVPDLDGRLGPGIDLRGLLQPGLVQRLSGLCADFGLSADLHIQSSAGEAAQVRFTHGKAESAALGGAPQMAMLALAVLSGWSSGHFLLRLRPLFGKEAPAEAPLFIERTTASSSRDFDVTGAIQIPSLRERESEARPAPPPLPLAPPAPPAPPPAPRPVTMAGDLTVRSLNPASQRTGPSLPTRPFLVASASESPRPRPRRSPVLFALLIGLCGGGLAFLGVMAWRLGPQFIHGLRRDPAPDRALHRSAPQGRLGDRDRDAGRASLGAAQVDLLPPPPAPPDKGRAESPQRATAQIERVVRLLGEGRRQKAVEALGVLRAQAPDDPDLPVLEQQVHGGLGRADLVITDKGKGGATVTVNGRAYAAPHKLRVPAGLCLIDGQRVVLKDGERREITSHQN